MSQNFKQPGRILSFLGSQIVCPAVNNIPTAGDPVVIGAAIVGVAETSAAATTDTVPVNVVGVYNVAVVAKHAGAVNDAVVVGDKLYIAAATAIVSKDATGLLFGVALGAINAGATANIDVRLTGSF